MTPEQWQRVKDVLATVLELSPGERSGYLDQRCASDVLLREQVEDLLEDESHVDERFLHQDDLVAAASDVFPAQEDEWIGRRVGAYRVVEQIGMGGMGEVYRAVRSDDEYNKEVALKVVRATQYSGRVVARFKNERQILAGLDHPNIAKLLDGGTADDGTPYFVMELIQGEPITTYCDRHHLSVGARLGLFLQVCSAVQYAHQRLIIHRDIKPSNILVTPDGIPKLLDFGIAKIVASDSQSNAAEETLTAFRVLTPRYASPEQVIGETITTTSDVYSLGVVLYELLAGVSPYRGGSTTGTELAFLVGDREVEKPSEANLALRNDGSGEIGNPEDVAALRDATPQKLQKQLKGDLDNIVVMALRKQANRRYVSVEQFAQDIHRHLEHIPILARQDSWSYRASKFWERHQAAALTSVVMLCLILAALALALYEAKSARAQRARAEQHFNNVRKLANSLLFEVHDRIRDLPGSTPVRQFVLSRAVDYLDSLSSDTGRDAALWRELATGYERIGDLEGHYGYGNLGDTKGGLASYQKALNLRRRLAAGEPANGEDQLPLAACLRRVAYQELSLGDTREAFTYIQQAVDVIEKTAAANPSNGDILYEQGFDYEIRGHIEGGNWSAVDLGDVQRAREDYARAVKIDEAMLQLNQSRLFQLALVNDLVYLGGADRQLSEFDSAAQNYNRALRLDEEMLGHDDVASTRRMLGTVKDRLAWLCEAEGNLRVALIYRRDLVKIYQELSNADPTNVLAQQDLGQSYVDLGRVMAALGDKESGLSLMDKGIGLNESVAAKNPTNAEQKSILAQLYVYRADTLAGMHRSNAAERVYDKALGIYAGLVALSATNAHARISMASCLLRVGHLEAREGRSNSAVKYYTEALAMTEPYASGSPTNPEAAYLMAEVYSELGNLYPRMADGGGMVPATGLYRTQGHMAFAKSREMWAKVGHRAQVSPYLFSVQMPDAWEPNYVR
jgi:non-specific serine/threonine protein kinase/serine/threonine-protein kinase